MVTPRTCFLKYLISLDIGSLHHDVAGRFQVDLRAGYHDVTRFFQYHLALPACRVICLSLTIVIWSPAFILNFLPTSKTSIDHQSGHLRSCRPGKKLWNRSTMSDPSQPTGPGYPRRLRSGWRRPIRSDSPDRNGFVLSHADRSARPYRPL